MNSTNGLESLLQNGLTSKTQLFLICHKCLRTRYDLVSIVYYQIPTLNSRLKLVEELIRANLPGRKRKSGGHDHPDLRRWISVQRELEALLATRRRIAHHPMRANIDYETQSGFRIHIETSFAEELRGRSENLLPLQQADLEQYVIKLQAVIKRLKSFYEATLPKHCG
jgi:hypothetical protein